jgi:hypothetical protein
MIEHYYKGVPGFFSFKSVYDMAIGEFNDSGVWVEVGCWQGKSLIYAVVESLQQNKKIDFHAVDIWTLHQKHQTAHLRNDQDLYEAFIKNTMPIKNHVTVHREFSWAAADHFPDGSVDFVMIDADHSYDSVIKDMRAWWPKIRPGGRMVGDDLRGSFPGVHQAIRQFSKENSLSWDKSSGCWLLKKS